MNVESENVIQSSDVARKKNLNPYTNNKLNNYCNYSLQKCPAGLNQSTF